MLAVARKRESDALAEDVLPPERGDGAGEGMR